MSYTAKNIRLILCFTMLRGEELEELSGEDRTKTTICYKIKKMLESKCSEPASRIK